MALLSLLLLAVEVAITEKEETLISRRPASPEELREADLKLLQVWAEEKELLLEKTAELEVKVVAL